MNPMRGAAAIGVLAGLAFLVVAPASAQIDSSTVTYELGSNASFNYGCYGPCLCPIRSEALRGTFDLRYVGSDPLFNNYEVSRVRWVLIPQGAANQVITGSGRYRVGGEFAVQHQLTLDLSIGGEPPKHFDSGLITGGGEFPKININISLHRNQACLDTVIHVAAAPDPPVTAVDVARNTPGFRVEGVVPNPFSAEASVLLTLDRAERIDVAVYDVQGRLLRNLAKGMPMSAGPHALSWDGRSADGAVCGTGVYFVKAESAGRRSSSRFVKVQ